MMVNHKYAIASILVLFLMLSISLITIIPAAASADNSTATENWKTANAVGKFLNSDPPKPDQIFKIHYRVINGTLERFDIKQKVLDVLVLNGVEAKITSTGSGILEIKFPRNFPYTSSQSGIENIIFYIENRFVGETQGTTTDCFFVFSVPYTGSAEIEMVIPTILMKAPYHGDDIPDSCMAQTVAADAPSGVQTKTPTTEQLLECSKLGIDEEDCTEIAILQKHQRQTDAKKTIEEQKIQVNNAIYIIGIGAVIAGVFAFITLRKR